MVVDLSQITFGEISKLYAQKEEYLEEHYGKQICELLGYQNIEKIKAVSADQLSLKHGKYHEEEGPPMQMKTDNIVRVEDSSKRWIIAMKCDLLDEDQRKITEVVELIFMRFPMGEGGLYREDQVVTSQRTKGANDKVYRTAFRTEVPDGSADLSLFKRVMLGETIDYRDFNSAPEPQPKYIKISGETFANWSNSNL